MRPTPAELEAARDAVLPDVLGPGLRVLLCGINPGLWSAATGHHFARPGNRFWPALHASGMTPRLLAPAEQHLLPQWGLGLTNVAPRATARADELSREEVVAGGRALVAKVGGAPAGLAGGARGDRLPRRVRAAEGGGRPAARRAGGDPGLGAAQPERPQRALERGRARRGVRPARAAAAEG